MKSLIACLVTVAAIAGCGSSDSSNPTSNTPPATASGTTATAGTSGTTGASTAAPEPTNAPASKVGFPVALYPGAKVLSQNKSDKTVQADIETPDAADKAIAFYEKELGGKSDGKVPMTTVQGKKNGFDFAVIIAPKPGGHTAISILGERK